MTAASHAKEHSRTVREREETALLSGFCEGDGDGGNRTHVRGVVQVSFYERSRRSSSRLPIAAPAGLREASPLEVPGTSRAIAPGYSPFLMPAIHPTGRGRADSRLPSC